MEQVGNGACHVRAARADKGQEREKRSSSLRSRGSRDRRRDIKRSMRQFARFLTNPNFRTNRPRRRRALRRAREND